jgi:protoheme ferro-lyase
LRVIQYWNRVNFLSLKNRFFGLTVFLAYGLPVLILTKTAQAYQQQCKAFFRHVLATTSTTKTEPNRVGWKTRSTGYCFVSGSDVHIEVFISLKLH